jgi:D-alanyl-D-alanine carboxypeptidase
MTTIRFRTVTLGVLLAAAPAAGQSTVDEFVRAEMERQRIPGLSLAVVKDGQVVKAAGYGVADRTSGTPATPETVYRIASLSKQFIAAGVLLLVQEGRLGIDDPVSQHVPDAPASWAGITIRHLLTHTAGLSRESPGFDPLRVRSDADVIRDAYGEPLRFRPGEKWEYSNLGYFILADVIRIVAGVPWTEWLHDRVFAPTGMATTFPSTAAAAVPSLARGYRDNDRLIDAPAWPALRPSGAFLSTVLDLAKWAIALDTEQPLTASTKAAMWSPATLNDGTSYPYGFGWSMGDVRDRPRVYHSGGMIGFRADFSRYVDDGVTIILLMNLDDVDIEALSRGVAAFYLPDSGTASRDDIEDAACS